MGSRGKNFEKNDQTHSYLNWYCFQIVSAMDFIQTLNKTEDFKLLILCSYVLLFLKSFTVIEILQF